MNFLLHRHLAAHELASEEAGIGAMLPDLWRMAERRMRPRSGVVVGEELEELGRGVLHHVEADAWFHACAVFVEGERALAREMVAVGVTKLVMFAHASWEMCLDGALLRAVDFDAELARLRREVALVDGRLPAIARAHGAEGARFDERMRRLVEGLTHGEWIGGYRSGEGVAERLAGMRSRFGLPLWSAAQGEEVARILEAALARAEPALGVLLGARERHLAGAA